MVVAAGEHVSEQREHDSEAEPRKLSSKQSTCVSRQDRQPFRISITKDRDPITSNKWG